MCDLCDGIYNSSDGGGGGFLGNWEDITNKFYVDISNFSVPDRLFEYNDDLKLCRYHFTAKLNVVKSQWTAALSSLFFVDSSYLVTKRFINCCTGYSQYGNKALAASNAGFFIPYDDNLVDPDDVNDWLYIDSALPPGQTLAILMSIESANGGTGFKSAGFFPLEKA